MGKRKYDNSNNATDEDFGRRRDDRIGIVEIFSEMQELSRTVHRYYEEHAKEISEVKQVLNNGIVTRTRENTEAIEYLANEISDVKDTVQKKENYKEGKMSTWQLILTIFSSIGSALLVTLTILYYLGVIF